MNQNSSNCLVVLFVLICASFWLLFTDKLWNIRGIGQMDTVESNPPTKPMHKRQNVTFRAAHLVVKKLGPTYPAPPPNC